MVEGGMKVRANDLTDHDSNNQKWVVQSRKDRYKKQKQRWEEREERAVGGGGWVSREGKKRKKKL